MDNEQIEGKKGGEDMRREAVVRIQQKEGGGLTKPKN